MHKEMLCGELVILLKQLPPDYRVACNEVRNLWVGKPDGQYCGYVDFMHKTVERFDTQEEESNVKL